MWVALIAVLAVGGYLLLGGRQDAAPQTGVGGGLGVLPERIEIQLDAVDKEQIDQSGSATLEEKDNKVTVTLNVNPVEGLNNQPAHIHIGSCPGVGEIVYPLNNVVDGKSVTEIEANINQFKDNQDPMAINIHKSAEESSVYTACGELPQ